MYTLGKEVSVIGTQENSISPKNGRVGKEQAYPATATQGRKAVVPPLLGLLLVPFLHRDVKTKTRCDWRAKSVLSFGVTRGKREESCSPGIYMAASP